MRTTVIKIGLLLFSWLVANFGVAYSAPSRIECLEKLGSAVTKAELDSCVNPPSSALLKPSKVSDIDSSPEESTCAELGFKRKTESYANCVLELLGRKRSVAQVNPNDPDAATCLRYGYKTGTNEYAACRQQIDQAKSQAAQQQAQYLQQQRQYQAQLDEQQRQRSVAAGMALFQMGTGIASGAYNANNSYGTMPTPPNPNRTYVLPGGKTMNCTTTGTVTSCF